MTGTDSQPEARSSPRVATDGDGVRGATDMGRPYRRLRPRRATRPRHPTGTRGAPAPAAVRRARIVPWLGDGPLGHRGGPRSPTTTCAAAALGLDYDDDGWEAIAGPRPLALARPPSPRATGRCSTGPASSSTPDPAAPATGWCSTASSTRATSGSTAPTSATPRATSSPTPTRSPTSPASRPSTCSPSRWPARQPQDRRAKRNLTGVFQHWDCIDPAWNPGGLWRPACASSGPGPVRIDRLRVLCRDAEPERATSWSAPSSTATRPAPSGSARPSTSASSASCEQSLAAGTNSVEWTFGVDNPRLWWPRAARRPAAVHDVDGRGVRRPRAEPRPHRPHRAAAGGDAPLGAQRQRRAAVPQGRQPRPDPHGPRRGDAGGAAPRRRARRGGRARPLRVHGHITRPELYEAADELGMLVWQDLPLQWGYARSVAQAGGPPGGRGRRPARPPPVGRDVVRAQRAARARRAPGEPRRRRAHAPSSSSPARSCRAGTGRSSTARVKRALERADGTRPVIAHSGVAPHLPQLDGTDSHLYFGWYHGEERDLPAFAAAWPRMVRFVSEFGAQAVPDDAAFMEPERWPDLDWERLQGHHALQKVVFDERVPPADHATFDGWQEATQRYQARLLRHHIEALRRLKYRPDRRLLPRSAWPTPIPAVTWSRARPRPHGRSWRTTSLAEACRPVIVVADRLPAARGPRRALALDVHVVSRPPRADRGRRSLGRPVLARRRPGLAVAGRRPGGRLRPGRDRPGRRAGDVPGRLVPRPRPRGRRRRRHQPLREPDHRSVDI